MNDKEKQILDKLKALKSDYPTIYRYIRYILMVLIVIIPLAIFGLYFIGDHGLVLIRTNLTVGDALAYHGSFLAFIGTVLLGALALWQNEKANKINERLFNLENSRENKVLFEMYFLYVEEFNNIFDPIYVLGKPNDGRSSIDIYNVIKSSQLKSLSIKRRLLLLDKDNSGHTYLEYVMDKYNEILSIVLNPSNSPEDIFKEVMRFIKDNNDNSNRKSLDFMYYIRQKFLKEE